MTGKVTMSLDSETTLQGVANNFPVGLKIFDKTFMLATINQVKSP